MLGSEGEDARVREGVNLGADLQPCGRWGISACRGRDDWEVESMGPDEFKEEFVGNGKKYMEPSGSCMAVNQIRDPPNINSSGSKGDRATNSPPNPHPTSATVTGLTKGRVAASACIPSPGGVLGDFGAT